MKLSLNPNTTTSTLSTLLLLLVAARDVLSVPRPQDEFSSAEPVSQDEAESAIQDEFNAEVSGQAQYESLPEPVPLTPEEEAALNAEATAATGNSSATTTNTTLTDAELEEILNGATGTVAELPRTSDPCGPDVQDGTEFNTCTRNPDGTANVDGSPYVHYSEEPAYYGVQCLPAAPNVAQKLNLKQCEFSKLCNATQNAEYSRDEWHWDEYGGEGCAVGIYIPGGPGVADVADKTRCRDAIFGTMGLYCDGGGEIAAVNVKTLPAGDAPGEPANPGYPRYIIAPQIL
ncbi:MAG: hypothetical protein Q9210_005095 [Variospora velana]